MMVTLQVGLVVVRCLDFAGCFLETLSHDASVFKLKKKTAPLHDDAGMKDNMVMAAGEITVDICVDSTQAVLAARVALSRLQGVGPPRWRLTFTGAAHRHARRCAKWSLWPSRGHIKQGE